MEIRTRIELIHSACPNCGEANFGGDNYCRSCGALLITQNILMDGASEEDIKELATAHKAAIVSIYQFTDPTWSVYASTYSTWSAALNLRFNF